MTRLLLNLLTALSLLLCVAALVLLVRGNRTGYMLPHGGEGTTLEVALGRGQLSVAYATHTPGLFDLTRRPGWRLVDWSSRYSAPSPFPAVLGFSWASRHPSPSVATFRHP